MLSAPPARISCRLSAWIELHLRVHPSTIVNMAIQEKTWDYYRGVVGGRSWRGLTINVCAWSTRIRHEPLHTSHQLIYVNYSRLTSCHWITSLLQNKLMTRNMIASDLDLYLRWHEAVSAAAGGGGRDGALTTAVTDGLAEVGSLTELLLVVVVVAMWLVTLERLYRWDNSRRRFLLVYLSKSIGITVGHVRREQL